MWNGWLVGVSKRGSDGRRRTDFYDVAIGDFDKALSVVRASVGKPRDVHVWIKEPLHNWQILSQNLRRGEIRRRPNSTTIEVEHRHEENDNFYGRHYRTVRSVVWRDASAEVRGGAPSPSGGQKVGVHIGEGVSQGGHGVAAQIKSSERR